MSLFVEIRVNREKIATIAAHRVAGDGCQPDDIGAYGIELDGEYVGMVAHRYGDGAVALVEEACRMVQKRQAND